MATHVSAPFVDPDERKRLNRIADEVWERRGLVAVANMRSNGVRDIIAYCTSGICHHGEVYNVDPLPDDACLKEIEKRMRCAHCGHLGADARPMWWSASFGPKPAAKPWPGGSSNGGGENKPGKVPGTV